MGRKCKITILATAVLGTLSLPSLAAITYVHPQGNYGNERCLAGPVCSGGTYDGAISIISAIEMDLGLAAGTSTRVDDDFDSLWRATINSGGQVMTRARYAGDTLRLGYDSGAGYVNLISNVANNRVMVSDPTMFAGDPRAGDFQDYGTPSWTTIPVAPDSMFAFVLRDITTNQYWSSNVSGSGEGSSGYANSVNMNDHMVSYRISDDHYIIAWEDRPFNIADLDYNDFVAEVRFLTAVPVPAAIWLFGSALLGLTGMALRRS